MLYPNTEVRMDSIKKMRPKYPPNTGTRYITPDHIIYKSIQKGNKKIHDITPLANHLISPQKTTIYKVTQLPTKHYMINI